MNFKDIYPDRIKNMSQYQKKLVNNSIKLINNSEKLYKQADTRPDCLRDLYICVDTLSKLNSSLKNKLDKNGNPIGGNGENFKYSISDNYRFIITNFVKIDITKDISENNILFYQHRFQNHNTNNKDFILFHQLIYYFRNKEIHQGQNSNSEQNQFLFDRNIPTIFWEDSNYLDSKNPRIFYPSYNWLCGNYIFHILQTILKDHLKTIQEKLLMLS